MTPKRKLYRIRIRRMVTGCDYIITIWLKSPADAFARGSKYVPLRERNWLRLVSCEPVEVQS